MGSMLEKITLYDILGKRSIASTVMTDLQREC